MNRAFGAADAVHDIRGQIGRIPLENISNLAKHALDKTSGIIPLWFGEGDLATPSLVGEAAYQAIRNGHTFYSYQNGIPELCAVLAKYHSELTGASVEIDRITVTSGGMPAIMLAVEMIVDRGDNVIVIDPVWPNIGGIVQVVGGEVRSVRMDHGAEGWTLDIDKVRAACDGKTKAIFFASPGNPTGAIIDMDTQKTLIALGRELGIWLLADEVYNRLVYGQRAGPSILTLIEPEDRVLVINSFSKAWAMTGWRLGWLVHPPSVGPILGMLTQFTSSGTTTFLQHGALAAIQHGEAFVAQMNAYCEAGMQLVCAELETMSRVRLATRPSAAMYVFFEIEGLTDSRAACIEVLEKTRVGLAPGYFFGRGSESFMRICYCRSPDALADAMNRLRPFLN
jgi:aspartate aminotransferase